MRPVADYQPDRSDVRKMGFVIVGLSKSSVPFFGELGLDVIGSKKSSTFITAAQTLSEAKRPGC